jgi:hypothetical protein
MGYAGRLAVYAACSERCCAQGSGVRYLRWVYEYARQMSREQATTNTTQTVALQAAAGCCRGAHNGRPAGLGSQKTKIKQKYTQNANFPVQCS